MYSSNQSDILVALLRVFCTFALRRLRSRSSQVLVRRSRLDRVVLVEKGLRTNFRGARMNVPPWVSCVIDLAKIAHDLITVKQIHDGTDSKVT